MADSYVTVTEGSGKNVDTRTNAGGDHRQVIVIGNESATDSIASVQASDPSSSALGVVVREPYSTNIVAGLDSVRVRNLIDGTLTTVTGVDRVRNLVDGTISSGTLDYVTRVRNLVDGTLTTVTGVDRVRNLVDGTISSGTLDYVTRVRNLVDGTVTVTGITNSIAVHVLSTNGTIGVDVGKVQQIDFVTRVRNVVDGTLTTVTGVDRVRNLVDGTLSLVSMVQRVNNVVDGTLSNVYRVHNLIDGTVKVSSSSSSIGVYFDRGNPAVNAYFNGNVAVTPNAGIPAINVYSTANIFTVSGSTSGGTTSGVTLISPSANASFKVFAFSLQTTGIVGTVWRFCNGSGASQTEFFRGLATANQTSSTPVGANLAVQPPGFLFATGVSTTLALVSDTGSLVHYTVSYFKESA